MAENMKIPMSSPEGVTLMTKGKLCDANIVITPELEELTVTESGEYVPSKVGYSKVNVNVAASGGDTLAEFLSWRNGRYLFYEQGNLATVPLFDTSKVTNMDGMFSGCFQLTTVPLFDTSKVTSMNTMFNYCTEITTVPLFDTSNVDDMGSMFSDCYNLTTVPPFDTRKVTNMSNMFFYCQIITDIRIRNIKANLTVSNGTSYGTGLTVDSLVHLIYELRKQSSTRTLTISTTNLNKLANVYVKAIDITDDMRAEDDLIDEKYPFVVCESTDEGAMLITDYATTVKNWTIK